jgi:hypothetical protein
MIPRQMTLILDAALEHNNLPKRQEGRRQQQRHPRGCRSRQRQQRYER